MGTARALCLVLLAVSCLGTAARAEPPTARSDLIKIFPGAAAASEASLLPHRPDPLAVERNTLTSVRRQLRRAVRKLSPAEAARVTVTPVYQRGGRTAEGQLAAAMALGGVRSVHAPPARRGKQPSAMLRLGDYRNDVNRFMGALRDHTRAFNAANRGLSWYSLAGVTLKRPHIPTVREKVGTWLRSKLAGRRRYPGR